MNFDPFVVSVTLVGRHIQVTVIVFSSSYVCWALCTWEPVGTYVLPYVSSDTPKLSHFLIPN
jgi:hypothetical protein